MPTARRDLMVKLSRFLVIGGLGFVLDAGIVGLLKHIGVPPLIGRIVSLAATVTFTFFANRWVTFRVQGRLSWHEFLAYVGASLAALALNYAIFAAGLGLGLPWPAAMAIGTVSAAAFNFLAYDRIFKRP